MSGKRSNSASLRELNPLAYACQILYNDFKLSWIQEFLYLSAPKKDSLRNPKGEGQWISSK